MFTKMRSAATILGLILTLIVIVLFVLVVYKFWWATQASGRWQCKIAYTLSSFPAFVSSMTGSSYAQVGAFIGGGAAGGAIAYKIASELGASGKVKVIATAIGFVVNGLLAYTALTQKVNPKILDVEERILSLCPCDIIDLEKETGGMCGKLKDWFRSDVYKALESEYGRCSEGSKIWRKIYYQAYIVRKIYETYGESLGIKTGVLHIHWAILIKHENDVGPLNEKDIDCYLYAMKFKDNDSEDILENFMPNLYSFRLGEEVTVNPITKESDIKLEHILPSYKYIIFHPIKDLCDLKLDSIHVPSAPDTIGNWVAYLDKTWTKSCYHSSPPADYLKDHLKKCGNFDRILMRKWDYLGDSDNPVILYISYNGDGRVLVTRCMVVIDTTTGRIKDTTCKPKS